MSYLDKVLQGTEKTKNRRAQMLSAMEEATSSKRAPVESPIVAAAKQALSVIPAKPAPMAPVGAPMRAPASKGKGGGNVDGWINQALSVLKLDSSYAPGIKHLIQKESGGNARAINKTDSNARRGTPSKGLMQTIDSTFKQHALPGYDKDVYDPVSNIIAGVRYARGRYGDDMLKNGGRKSANGKYKGY